MIQVSIHYPNREGSQFDLDYYFDRHMPTAIRLLSPALRGVTAVEGVSGAAPGQPAPYAASCYFLFDSAEAFYQAFLPHALALQEDILAYTDVEPIIQIGEVRIPA